MNAKKIFLSTLLVIGIVLLVIGFFVGTSPNVSADDVKDKVSDEEYLDYIRSIETNEAVGVFTKYFIPDTKTVEIYDDKLKPMLNMTWITEYEEKVSSGAETQVACARIDYIDDKVLPVFNQIKSYDKKNNYESIDKDFTMKIKQPIVSERCYDEIVNNETNESEEVCYEYDDTELIEIDSLIDVKYFPQEVCWYTETVEGDNIEFVIGNGDFWLVEFASFLVDDLVGYWKFDNNDFSDSLFVNNGTNFGTTNIAGKIEDAREFNAIGEYITISSAGNSPFDFAGDFSVGFWINPTSLATYNIMGNWQLNSGEGGWRFYMLSDGSITYQEEHAASYPQVKSKASFLSTGSWQYVIFVKSSNVGNWYVGNVESSSYQTRQALSSITASTQGWEFGRHTGHDIQMNLDEVAIYSKALNSEERSELYNNNNGFSYPFVKPTCQFSGYVFDEEDNALVGANITIWNQFDISESYENTTIAGGVWSIDVENSTNTYMVGAYYNNTLIGQLKPYVSGTC